MAKNNFQKILIQGIMVALVFTLLDYLAHSFSILPNPSILPSGYFLYKILTVTALFVIYPYLFRFKETIFSIVTVLILQIRYYSLGIYDIKTNILMIIAHYILLRSAFYIFNQLKGRKL